MTCIVAMVDDSASYIACDSLGSGGGRKNSYRNKKIFQRESFLFGYTGSFRAGQLLQYSLWIPPRKVGQNLDDYLHVDLVNAVRSTYETHKFEDYSEFLIVAEGRIFTLQNDLSLLESQEGFEATGSGEDYARAVMHSRMLHSEGTDNVPEILTEAIEIAGLYIGSVGGDIHHLKKEHDG